MSKGLNSSQKTEIGKNQVKTRTLLTITENNEDVIRIIENDVLTSFIYDGNTYLGAMVRREPIESRIEGGPQRVNIKISNIGKSYSNIIATEGDVLTNSRCVIEEVIFNGFPADWQGATSYSADDYISPVVKNSYIYQCTTAGTTGSEEPEWPTSIDSTVSDGTAVWTCKSPLIGDPVNIFEGYINNVQLTDSLFTFDVERVLGGYSTFSPNTTYDVNCQWIFKDSRCQYSGEETTCDKTFSACQARSNEIRFGGYPSIPSELVIKA